MKFNFRYGRVGSVIIPEKMYNYGFVYTCILDNLKLYMSVQAFIGYGESFSELVNVPSGIELVLNPLS